MFRRIKHLNLFVCYFFQKKKKKEFKPVGDDDLDDYDEEEKVCYLSIGLEKQQS